MKIYSRHVLIGHEFLQGTVEFGDKTERFAAGTREPDSVDLGDFYLIPGLVDIHTHGAMGADASDGDPEGLTAMSRFYAENGVTSWCPTTMTLQEAELTKAVKAAASFRRPEDGAKAAGIHLEGPFVSPEKRGAQNIQNIRRPDAGMIRRLQEAADGKIRMITMAPELEGGIPFIREVSGSCPVSVGHTMAGYDTAMAAFSAGADHVTHLYNAMPPLHHRMPGVIGAAYDSGASAELICDGMHVHPSAVRIAFRLFEGRICLISDSLRCTGMPDGEYPFGGQTVTLKEHRAAMKGTDTLAGSVISLMEGVRRAASFGIPLAEAVYAASETPAEAIRMEDQIGSIEAGKCADYVALDQDLQVRDVWIDGKKRPTF